MSGARSFYVCCCICVPQGGTTHSVVHEVFNDKCAHCHWTLIGMVLMTQWNACANPLQFVCVERYLKFLQTVQQRDRFFLMDVKLTRLLHAHPTCSLNSYPMLPSDWLSFDVKISPMDSFAQEWHHQKGKSPCSHCLSHEKCQSHLWLTCLWNPKTVALAHKSMCCEQSNWAFCSFLNLALESKPNVPYHRAKRLESFQCHILVVSGHLGIVLFSTQMRRASFDIESGGGMAFSNHCDYPVA